MVRINTYQYDKISNRTEEFYLRNGELFLAIIKNNGEGERGKPMEEVDKLYFFSNGELCTKFKKRKRANTP